MGGRKGLNRVRSSLCRAGQGLSVRMQFEGGTAADGSVAGLNAGAIGLQRAPATKLPGKLERDARHQSVSVTRGNLHRAHLSCQSNWEFHTSSDGVHTRARRIQG